MLLDVAMTRFLDSSRVHKAALFHIKMRISSNELLHASGMMGTETIPHDDQWLGNVPSEVAQGRSLT
jgi:hypothetical protein